MTSLVTWSHYSLCSISYTCFIGTDTSLKSLYGIASTILELFAFNAQKFKGLRGPGHAPFSKKISGVITGLSLGARVPNLKFVSLIILELLGFNAQTFTGSRDPGYAPFSKKISGVMSGLSLGACMPNLKFVPLVTLELLAFNTQKFKGHVTCHAPFYPLLTFGGWRPSRDNVWTMNRYNRFRDNASEVFQRSHWKCIM